MFTVCREDGTTVIIQQAEGGEMVIAENTLEQSIESDTPLQIATDGTVQVVSTEEEQVSTICQFVKIADIFFYINYMFYCYKIYTRLFVCADLNLFALNCFKVLTPVPFTYFNSLYYVMRHIMRSGSTVARG